MVGYQQAVLHRDLRHLGVDPGIQVHGTDQFLSQK